MDLGTLGGSFGLASWINKAGDVLGGATTENDEAFFAFLWKKWLDEESRHLRE
jgi:uncharacterized membrane protein